MKKHFAVIAVLTACSFFAAGAEPVKKEGGVGFRYDDNRTAAMWNEVAGIFEKYQFPLMYAVNTGRSLTPEQLICLQELVKKGHEIMDHTLNHRVFAFSFPDAARYAREPWVDHIKGENVYIKYIFRNDVPARHAPVKFKADIAGRRITLPPEMHKLFNGSRLLKYQGKAYLVQASRKEKGVFELKSFWGEAVDLGNIRAADVETCSKDYGFSVPPEAMKAMAEIVAERFDAMKLPRPTAWIQPGSPEAIIQADNVRQGLKEAGYICAATYQDSAFKFFGESNPERCAFAMMWGQFRMGAPQDTVEIIKTRIADAYARHQVLFGSSHMTDHKLPGGWPEFLKRHEELLAWCHEKKIPVRTQSQWAKLLYYSKTDPAQNVFPPWTADRDDNKRPDGYTKLGKNVSVNAQGELVAPEQGDVFHIPMLGGVEKGKNTLQFQVKSGSLRCTVAFVKRFKTLNTVIFTGSEKTFEVPAEADYIAITLRNTGDTPLILTGASLKQQ